MKKLILLLSLILIMCTVFAVCVFADAEGYSYTKTEYTHINAYWKYVSGTKTLYLYSSLEGTYHETGKYDSEGAWGAYKNEIEHVVILGKFSKISNNAFQDHKALISVTSDIGQVSQYAFYGCTNLKRYNSEIDGWAVVKGSTEKGAFTGTAIKNVKVSSAKSVMGTSGTATPFPSGANVYVPEGATASENLAGTDANVIVNGTCNVNIFIDGVKKTFTFEKSDSLLFPTIDGKCYALFEDISCTRLYTGQAAAKTFYAKSILEYLGSEVRCSDYHGLRAVYEINEDCIPAGAGYSVYEYGVLSRVQDGIDLDVFYDVKGTNKAVAYTGGSYGELLAPPSEGIATFASTMIGQNTVEKAETEFLFRGYVILQSSSGEKIIRYTDPVDQSLANAEYLTYNKATSSGKLTDGEREFVSSFLNSGATPTYAYTRDELISVMRDVYNSNTYIPGEYISSHGIYSWLTRAKLASGGEYPAILGFDFKDGGAFSDEKFEYCVEYVEKGGILEFSYHMTCPCGADHSTSSKPTNWCSGQGGENVFAQLITENGNVYNTNLRAQLDLAAETLGRFDELGIPVLWRPFHEHNGDWFWWCLNQWNYRGGTISPETFAKLWRYAYTYMTETCGLDNLVWVLAPSPGLENNTLWDDGHYSKSSATLGYPGDAYVDIVGIDWYATAYSDTAKETYNALDALSGDTIFAITECGGSGASGYTCTNQNALMKTTMQNGVKFCYTLNWSGTDSMLHTGDLNVLMADPTTLGVSEVKALFDAYYNER